MPYWRLSAFYFFNFAVFGVLIPYGGLYLRSIGFEAHAIGVLMALPMFARIVAPPVSGWFADHFEAPIRTARITALLAWMVSGVLLIATDFWLVAVTMFVFAFFWHGSLPLLEASTLRHVAGDPGGYARVRWWGSFGFIAAVTSLGSITAAVGPRWVPVFMLACLFVIWIVALALPRIHVARTGGAADAPFHRALLRPEVMAFFGVGILSQIGHGPYSTFFTIHISDLGYSVSRISVLWGLSVVAEIAAFLAMPLLLRHFGPRQILLTSLSLGGLRWLLIGHLSEVPLVLVFAQLLHAASFGITHAVCIFLVHQYFSGRGQNRGQGLYVSLKFGVGGAIGALFSGFAWGTLGPTMTYDIAALAALGGVILTAIWVKPKS